jgi:hypothetical protein
MTKSYSRQRKKCGSIEDCDLYGRLQRAKLAVEQSTNGANVHDANDRRHSIGGYLYLCGQCQTPGDCAMRSQISAELQAAAEFVTNKWSAWWSGKGKTGQPPPDGIKEFLKSTGAGWAA